MSAPTRPALRWHGGRKLAHLIRLRGIFLFGFGPSYSGPCMRPFQTVQRGCVQSYALCDFTVIVFWSTVGLSPHKNIAATTDFDAVKHGIADIYSKLAADKLALRQRVDRTSGRVDIAVNKITIVKTSSLQNGVKANRLAQLRCVYETAFRIEPFKVRLLDCAKSKGRKPRVTFTEIAICEVEINKARTDKSQSAQQSPWLIIGDFRYCFNGQEHILGCNRPFQVRVFKIYIRKLGRLAGALPGKGLEQFDNPGFKILPFGFGQFTQTEDRSGTDGFLFVSQPQCSVLKSLFIDFVQFAGVRFIRDSVLFVGSPCAPDCDKYSDNAADGEREIAQDLGVDLQVGHEYAPHTCPLAKIKQDQRCPANDNGAHNDNGQQHLPLIVHTHPQVTSSALNRYAPGSSMRRTV